MDQDRKKDWRELCTAAATELDPAKLMRLISEITRALDERDKKQQNPTREALKEEDRISRPFRSEAAIG